MTVRPRAAALLAAAVPHALLNGVGQSAEQSGGDQPQSEGNFSKDPYLPIRYRSAALRAKNQVLVNDQFPNWEIRGEFQAPSAPGTWPAFWITGANSWPRSDLGRPEV